MTHTFPMPGLKPVGRAISKSSYDDLVQSVKIIGGTLASMIKNDLKDHQLERATEDFALVKEWLASNAGTSYEIRDSFTTEEQRDPFAGNGTGADLMSFRLSTEVLISDDDTATLFKLTWGGN